MPSPILEKKLIGIPYSLVKWRDNRAKLDKVLFILAILNKSVCNSTVFRMTARDICANSAHDPVCEQLMDAHDIYANSALGIYANGLCQ